MARVGQARAGQRQGMICRKVADVARPVHPRRILELGGMVRKKLAQQERAEGAEQGGDDQRPVRVRSPRTRIRMKTGMIVTWLGDQ